MSASERQKILASLVEALEASTRRLADRATPGDALEFLDLLVRCESFPGGAVEASGSGPVLEAAAKRRSEQASDLGELAARAVDPEGLLEQAFLLINAAEEGETPDALGWAGDLLRLANVTPHLPEAARGRAVEVIEEVLHLIEANPIAFAAIADVAVARRSREHPQGIRDTLGADLLDAFLEARELAAYDREHGASAGRARPWPRLVADPHTPSAARTGAIPGSAAEDDTAGTREPLLLAAAPRDYGIGEHALLRRLEGGEFVLTRIGKTLFVEWYGAGTPALSISEEGGLRTLASEAIEDGLRWELPASGERLSLEASLGEIRIELVIPA